MSQAPSLPADKNHSRVTFGRTLRSEWVKFWSLKSTYWILGVTTVLMIGFAALMALALKSGFNHCSAPSGAGDNGCTPSDMAQFGRIHTTQILYTGTAIGDIVLSILGIMLITNEYSSGMIRSTLASVPRRSPMLWAKALVAGTVSFVVSFISSWLGLFAGAPILNPSIKKYVSPANVNQFSAEALHVTAGIALVTALIVLFALGVGALIRNTGGSIGIVLGILFVLSILFSALPWQWAKDLGQYVPNQAGGSVYALSSELRGSNLLPFWTGLTVVLLWAIVPLIAANVSLKKRDA